MGRAVSISGGDLFRVAAVASIRMSTLLESDMFPASLQSERFPEGSSGDPPNEEGINPPPPGAEVVGVPVLSPELEEGLEVGVAPPWVLWVSACCFMLP